MMVITLLAELGALVLLRIPNILQQKAEDSDDQDDEVLVVVMVKFHYTVSNSITECKIPLHSVKFHYRVPNSIHSVKFHYTVTAEC